MISSEETEDNNDDLDKKILRNAKTKKIARKIFFSRSVIVFVTIGVPSHKKKSLRFAFFRRKPAVSGGIDLRTVL